MYRLSSLGGAGSRIFGKQQLRWLRIYLGATTFLFAFDAAALPHVRFNFPHGSPVGKVAAVILGAAALSYLAIHPRHLVPATALAMAATPLAMAFYVTMTAEYICLIAPMCLAMYLRAFHPPHQAWPSIALLAAGCVVAVAAAPAPKIGLLTFAIIAVAIVGAAESFGFLLRAMVTAACTDPMTGLLNRAGWEIATAERLTRGYSTPGPNSVVALDIDNLKQFNDTWGHQAGDRRIVEYAWRWAQLAPRNSVLARLGGDEFAVLIVGKTTSDVAEFLRAHVRRRSLDVEDPIAFSEMASYMLIKRDDRWWLAAGQNTIIQPGQSATD